MTLRLGLVQILDLNDTTNLGTTAQGQGTGISNKNMKYNKSWFYFIE